MVGIREKLGYYFEPEELDAALEKPLDRIIHPFNPKETAYSSGSTDVGDVSYQCPTAQIHVAVWPNHVPCHSWQVVSCNKTPMAHKATVHAGKVLCAAAIDLLEQPALLEAAKAEFRQRTAGGYNCPIPADAVPAPLEL